MKNSESLTIYLYRTINFPRQKVYTKHEFKEANTINKWYDKEKNTFSVLTKDSLSVYELDELYNYPRLELFNFLDVDLVSIKEVWQNSQEHPLYNDACRVIQEIESLFDTVYETADEHYDELINHLCHFNDLSKENQRFVFDVNNIATKC